MALSASMTTLQSRKEGKEMPRQPTDNRKDNVIIRHQSEAVPVRASEPDLGPRG